MNTITDSGSSAKEYDIEHRRSKTIAATKSAISRWVLFLETKNLKAEWNEAIVFYQSGYKGHDVSQEVQGVITNYNKHDNFMKTSSISVLARAKIVQDSFCDISIFKEFGRYLLDDAKQRDGSSYLGDTVVQYISGAKEDVRSKYPKHNVWIDHTMDVNNVRGWYTKLRTWVIKYCTERANREGVKDSSDVLPTGREIVGQMTSYFLSLNTPVDIEKACVILSTFLAIGRAGEATWISWNQCYYDTVLRIFVLDWNEMKTSKQHQMPMFPDAESYSLCWNFLHFCYLVTGGGERVLTTKGFRDSCILKTVDPAKRLFVYPFLSIGDGGTRCTSYIKDCVGNVEGLPVGIDDLFTVSAKCLRYGGEQECAMDTECGREAADYRGGWEPGTGKIVATSSTYMKRCIELSWRAGKAISGWRNCRVTVYPAELIFLTDEIRPQFHAFLTEVMANQNISIMRTHLKQGGYILFAAYLRYFDEFSNFRCIDGRPHIVVKKVHDIAKKHGFHNHLQSWAAAVKSNFFVKNHQNLHSYLHDVNESVRPFIQALTEAHLNTQCMLLKQETLTNSLLAHVKLIEKDVASLNTQLNKFNVIHGEVLTSNSSPSKSKKRRINECSPSTADCEDMDPLFEPNASIVHEIGTLNSVNSVIHTLEPSVKIPHLPPIIPIHVPAPQATILGNGIVESLCSNTTQPLLSVKSVENPIHIDSGKVTLKTFFTGWHAYGITINNYKTKWTCQDRQVKARCVRTLELIEVALTSLSSIHCAVLKQMKLYPGHPDYTNWYTNVATALSKLEVACSELLSQKPQGRAITLNTVEKYFVQPSESSGKSTNDIQDVPKINNFFPTINKK